MSTAVSLDELIGLCDEISALTREGIPLETALSSRTDSGTGDRLRALAATMKNGESLSEAIRRDDAFPPFCATVVEAGLESGNVSGMLDTIASLARQLRDSRLFIVRATLYPLFLFTVLWLALCGVFFFLAPIYPSFFESFEIKTAILPVMDWLSSHGEWSVAVALFPPCAVWGGYLVWSHRSNRSLALNANRAFRWVPWLAPAIEETRQGAFARNLALMLEASVPLDRALELVDQSVGGNASDRERVVQWARRITGPTLVRGLNLVADNAQMRARWSLTRCELFLPALTLGIFALVLVVSYFLVIEWPVLQILYHLATPFNG